MRKQYRSERLSSDLLIFAHRILRQRYQKLSVISAQARDLLFAEVEGYEGVRYSEFHMSSGERTILRISKDISHLEDALILIDEVDTGLHPYTQQQLMLELQRIALRQRLQIIVASHSPVILDSVPLEGRKFLDRDEQTTEVRLMPAYRDIAARRVERRVQGLRTPGWAGVHFDVLTRFPERRKARRDLPAAKCEGVLRGSAPGTCRSGTASQQAGRTLRARRHPTFRPGVAPPLPEASPATRDERPSRGECRSGRRVRPRVVR